MIGIVLRFLIGISLRIFLSALFVFLGALISLIRWLAPILFRLSVSATAIALSLIDQRLDGRLVDHDAATYLVSGMLWTLAGMVMLVLFNFLLSSAILDFVVSIAIAGFGFGLLCGFRAQRLPEWGRVAEENDLQLGEYI